MTHQRSRSTKPIPQGLSFARTMMVLSGFSPLFLLWAMRGSNFIPDKIFVPVCVSLVVIPNLFLLLRLYIAKKQNETRILSIERSEDHRDHVLVYLLAMLLPFYSEDLSDMRSFVSTLLALSFVIFTFHHLNLHYLNLLFAIFGYRIFTIYPPKADNPLTGNVNFVLLTRRYFLPSGDKVTVYRISDTVYIEKQEGV